VICEVRIAVDLILKLLTSGMTLEEIAEDYKICVDEVQVALPLVFIPIHLLNL